MNLIHLLIACVFSASPAIARYQIPSVSNKFLEKCYASAVSPELCDTFARAQDATEFQREISSLKDRVSQINKELRQMGPVQQEMVSHLLQSMFNAEGRNAAEIVESIFDQSAIVNAEVDNGQLKVELLDNARDNESCESDQTIEDAVNAAADKMLEVALEVTEVPYGGLVKRDAIKKTFLIVMGLLSFGLIFSGIFQILIMATESDNLPALAGGAFGLSLVVACGAGFIAKLINN